MSHSRLLESQQTGPIQLTLAGESDIEVIGSPDAVCCTAEVRTTGRGDQIVKLIDELTLQESAGEVRLIVPAGAGTGTIVTGGGDVVVVGNGVSMTQTFAGARGYTRVVVNGDVIEKTSDGRTIINGVDVTAAAATGQPTGGGALAPIHVRAWVPAGSQVTAKAYNGRITCTNVAKVRISSHNKSVTATGLTEDSKVSSYNGNITVGAAPGHRPVVEASTHNGDIRVLDDDIRVRPRTHNGSVRYPR